MTSPLDGRLAEAIECLLFATPEPLSLDRIASILEVDEASAHRAIATLRLVYAGGRGIQMRQVAGGYQLVSHPDFGVYVTRLLSAPPSRLSRAALETLAIIAYQQPITLPEIEAFRGVNSSGVVRTLSDRGLVHESGRRETAGRPALYVTTDEFLMHFGLKDLGDLPDLEDLTPDAVATGPKPDDPAESDGSSEAA